jgi:hypothetical protein
MQERAVHWVCKRGARHTVPCEIRDTRGGRRMYDIRREHHKMNNRHSDCGPRSEYPSNYAHVQFREAGARATKLCLDMTSGARSGPQGQSLKTDERM